MNDGMLRWHELTSEEQLANIREESKERPVIIFKHSTRCSTSRLVLQRLERNWNSHEMENVKAYFLDLLSYRSVSNSIAKFFQVEHESPQILVIAQGKSVYDQSHLSIDYHDLRSKIGLGAS